MILDALNVLADAQTGTVSAASTDYLDTLAAGDSYDGSWFVFRMDSTATAAAGSPTATVQIQTASNTDFLAPDAVTLAQSAAFGYASLTAGKFWAIRLPMGTKRYIRGYVSVSSPNNNFSALVRDMFIVKDISRWSNSRYAL